KSGLFPAAKYGTGGAGQFPDLLPAAVLPRRCDQPLFAAYHAVSRPARGSGDATLGGAPGAAPLTKAQALLAQGTPPTMLVLQKGSRDHEVAAHDGGVEARWSISASAHRYPQAQRTADKRGRKRSEANPARSISIDLQKKSRVPLGGQRAERLTVV